MVQYRFITCDMCSTCRLYRIMVQYQFGRAVPIIKVRWEIGMYKGLKGCKHSVVRWAGMQKNSIELWKRGRGGNSNLKD